MDPLLPNAGMQLDGSTGQKCNCSCSGGGGGSAGGGAGPTPPWVSVQGGGAVNFRNTPARSSFAAGDDPGEGGLGGGLGGAGGGGGGGGGGGSGGSCGCGPGGSA